MTVKKQVTTRQLLSSRLPRTPPPITEASSEGTGALEIKPTLDREKEAHRESNLPGGTGQSPVSFSKQRAMMSRTGIKKPLGPWPAGGGHDAVTSRPSLLSEGSLLPKEPPTQPQALRPCPPRAKTVPKPFKAAEGAAVAP